MSGAGTSFWITEDAAVLGTIALRYELNDFPRTSIAAPVHDITRSEALDTDLFCMPPRRDFSGQIDDPALLDDPDRTYGGCSFTFGGHTLGRRPVAPVDDTCDPHPVGLDHVRFRVGGVAESHLAAARLTAAGITHGEVTDLAQFGLACSSVQDPGDIQPRVR